MPPSTPTPPAPSTLPAAPTPIPPLPISDKPHPKAAPAQLDTPASPCLTSPNSPRQSAPRPRPAPMANHHPAGQRDRFMVARPVYPDCQDVTRIPDASTCPNAHAYPEPLRRRPPARRRCGTLSSLTIPRSRPDLLRRPRTTGHAKIGVGLAHWFAPPLPPNRTSSSPGSPVDSSKSGKTSTHPASLFSLPSGKHP